jgi:hypothetical protein
MKKEYNFSSIKESLETEKMLNSSINKRKSPDFYGYDNFAEFNEVASKKFNREFSNEISEISTINIINDVTGYAPNIVNFINGEPEDMYNFSFTENVNYHELNFYISLSWRVTAKEIAKQGQILAKYLQDNTSNKDKFKITFFGNFMDCYIEQTDKRMADKRLELEIIVADYDDYITDNIFNTICSPCFFRLYMYNLISLAYGYDSNMLNGSPEAFETAKEKNTTLMDFMNMEYELNQIIL